MMIWWRRHSPDFQGSVPRGRRDRNDTKISAYNRRGNLHFHINYAYTGRSHFMKQFEQLRYDMRNTTQIITKVSFGAAAYSWVKGVRAPVSFLKDYVAKPMFPANSNGMK